MNIKKFMLAGLVLSASLAALAEDVLICQYGGTNDPYTVENPLACDKFTYVGAGTGAAGIYPDSLASFLSGTHTIAGQFLSSGACTKYSKNADLVISGSDTVVTANDVLIQNIRNTDGFNCTVDGIPFRTRFFITDGATLKAENGFKMEPSAWYKPLVSIDGGTLEIAQGDFNLYSSASTGYVHSVNGATVKVTNGNLVLGRTDQYGQGRMVIGCTNTTFTAKALSAQVGTTANFKSCDFFFDDASEMFVQAGTHYDSPAPRLTFEDCMITNAKADKLGYNSDRFDDWGRMTISGGSAHFKSLQLGSRLGDNFELAVSNKANVTVDSDIWIGNGATGTLELVDAKLTSPYRLRGHAHVGYSGSSANLNAFGHLRVGKGGHLDMGRMTVNVGYSVKGLLEVEEGGTLTARTITIGTGGAAAGAAGSLGSRLLVRGGRVNNVPTGTDGYAVTEVTKFNTTEATLELEDCVYETLAIKGGAGTSHFLADGVILRPTLKTHQYPLLSALTTAQVGAKGLTFDIDTGDTGVSVTQALANKPGEEAIVRKTGTSDLTLAPTSWTVSKTSVEGGRLLVTEPTLTLNTELVVTNGAVLSLQDGKINTLTVDKLAVLGGALAIDPGDKIVVTGEADISALTLNVSSKPETGTDLTIIEAGTLSARSAKALVRAMSEGFAFDEKTYGKFTASDDGEKVSVRFTVKVEADPLTGDALTTWQGTSSDGWTSDGSWTGGVPAVGKKAVFPAAAAEKSVEVPDDAEATALSFGGDYALASGSLVLDGDRGAVEIEATAGKTAVSTPITLRDMTSVPVAAGAVLALNGSLADGGFTKTGSGRLELGAANTLALPVTLAGGLVSLADGGAFGESRVTLKKDTLEVDSGDAEVETVIPGRIEINVDSQYKGVVLKTDTPATMPVIKSVQGALLKRGVAPLTLECRNGDSVMGKWACANQNNIQLWLEFPEDGTFDIENSSAAGSGGAFTAFTIAEGEVVLKPAPGETLPTVMASADGTYVGVKHTNGTVRARMTLDGVRYDCGDRSVFLCGYNAGNDYIDLPGGAVRIPLVRELLKSELCICNGAILSCGNFTSSSFGNKPEMTPTLALTNGTLAAVNFSFSYNNITPTSLEPTACSRVRAKDSTLTAATGFKTMLRTDGDFDNTFFGSSTEGTLGTMTFTDGAAGTMLFRNGSVFACAIDFGTFRSRYPLAGETMTLAFDDAEWRYGTGDFTFDPEIPNDAADAFLLEMRGKGVKLAPAEGTTFETRFPFTGEGGLIVDGPGTVKFAANTLKFTGAACVRQGTLDAGGQAVAISLQPGDELPTLKDCAPRGKIQVDMGGAVCEKGDSFAVARISGSTPLRFKAVNFADPELYGYFTVQDGLVTMTVGPKPGLSIIVR